MRFQGLFAAVVAVGLVGLTNVNTADAGLFGNYGYGYGYGNSGCCGASDGSCCEAPPSCDPCCDTSSGCGGHLGLFSKLFGGCGRRSSCGGCDTCCEPEPTCGCEVVEPTCGCSVEPACGCDSGCGNRRHGGFFRNLFSCHRSSSCCEPTGGCEPVCEPTCGCR